MQPLDLFIFAGEPSADVHGEKLIRALKEKRPNLTIYGVGGPLMRAAGMQTVLAMEKFQVMGFIDVLIALPRLAYLFFSLLRFLLQRSPSIVILIDYPGFNLRLAKHLRKRGFRGKICHYICPSVWAWGKHRIEQMARTLDLLLVILPFEAELFAHTGLEVAFVGHPLVQRIADHTYAPLPFKPERSLVALFPGSRKKELERNLSIHLLAAKQLLEKGYPLAFAISVGHPSFAPQIEKAIKRAGLKLGSECFLANHSQTYDLMHIAQLAIAKSGTVTLELALHAVPTAVTYGLARLDLWIAKYLLRLRLPYYCIVNIIASTSIFPELIGPELHANALVSAVEQFLTNSSARKRCLAGCGAVKTLLTDKDASKEAAQIILGKWVQ